MASSAGNIYVLESIIVPHIYIYIYMKDLTYTFAYIYFGAWGVAAV